MEQCTIASEISIFEKTSIVCHEPLWFHGHILLAQSILRNEKCELPTITIEAPKYCAQHCKENQNMRWCPSRWFNPTYVFGVVLLCCIQPV